MFATSRIVGTSRTLDYCDWLVASVALVSKPTSRSTRLTLSLIVGSSRRPYSIPLIPEASSATATPILPTRLHWSAAPRCASPRPGPSTGPSEKPTESASAASKSSGRSRLRKSLCASHPNSNGHTGSNGSSNGQPRLRDQLCLLIRQHNLDPTLVKAYAADFCGTRNSQGSQPRSGRIVRHPARGSSEITIETPSSAN